MDQNIPLLLSSSTCNFLNMKAGLFKQFNSHHSVFSLLLKGVEVLLFNSPLVSGNVLYLNVLLLLFSTPKSMSYGHNIKDKIMYLNDQSPLILFLLDPRQMLQSLCFSTHVTNMGVHVFPQNIMIVGYLGEKICSFNLYFFCVSTALPVLVRL